MAQLTPEYRKVLMAVAALEAGRSVSINRGDAEECEDLGLLEVTGRQGYVLTDRGRRALKEGQDSN